MKSARNPSDDGKMDYVVRDHIEELNPAVAFQSLESMDAVMPGSCNSWSSRHPSRRLVALLACLVISCLSIANIRGDEPRDRGAEFAFRGKIVFFGVQRKGDLRSKSIVAINPDGSGLETHYTISDEGRSIDSGRVSPDARNIAFTIFDQTTMKGQVWLQGSKGDRRKVLDDGMVRSWSPDGTKLACIGGQLGKWKSFVFDLATKEARPLLIPEVDHVDDWSPDGKYLSVMLGRPDKTINLRKSDYYPLRQIELIKPGGDGRQVLTSNPAVDNLWARFSPDGKRVAHYQREYRDGQPLESSMIRDCDGSNALVVLAYSRLDEDFRPRPEGRPIWEPDAAGCWSPDGKTVAWLVSNTKSLKGDPAREEKLRFALIFTSSTGGVERTIDLKALGLASCYVEIDWASDAK